MESNFKLSSTDGITVEHTANSKKYRVKLINRKSHIVKVMIGLVLFWCYSMFNWLRFDLSWETSYYFTFSIIASVMTIVPMIWSFKGYEEIELFEDQMVIRNRFWKLGWSKKYMYKDIRDVSLNTNYKEVSRTKFNIFHLSEIAGVNIGYVRFIHITNEVKFGNTFTPQQAIAFVDILSKEVSGYERGSNYA